MDVNEGFGCTSDGSVAVGQLQDLIWQAKLGELLKLRESARFCVFLVITFGLSRIFFGCGVCSIL